MTILAQSLLTLVSSHLVALLFLSVWHNTKILIIKLLHHLNKTLGGLESRNVVSINHHRYIL